jgi:hypothetical protein
MGKWAGLTVMEDFPAVFPCFSKDLDSFLWETICTKENKKRYYHVIAGLFLKYCPLQNSAFTTLLEIMMSISIYIPSFNHVPLLIQVIPFSFFSPMACDERK